MKGQPCKCGCGDKTKSPKTIYASIQCRYNHKHALREQEQECLPEEQQLELPGIFCFYELATGKVVSVGSSTNVKQRVWTVGKEYSSKEYGARVVVWYDDADINQLRITEGHIRLMYGLPLTWVTLASVGARQIEREGLHY